ncbi:hypothetical protein J1614_006813 [Plenodomus biglobosus]|nr:hypothetical protein J1614_006813 [Plenodomus biglobosus]
MNVLHDTILADYIHLKILSGVHADTDTGVGTIRLYKVVLIRWSDPVAMPEIMKYSRPMDTPIAAWQSMLQVVMNSLELVESISDPPGTNGGASSELESDGDSPALWAFGRDDESPELGEIESDGDSP